MAVVAVVAVISVAEHNSDSCTKKDFAPRVSAMSSHMLLPETTASPVYFCKIDRRPTAGCDSPHCIAETLRCVYYPSPSAECMEVPARVPGSPKDHLHSVSDLSNLYTYVPGDQTCADHITFHGGAPASFQPSPFPHAPPPPRNIESVVTACTSDAYAELAAAQYELALARKDLRIAQLELEVTKLRMQ